MLENLILLASLATPGTSVTEKTSPPKQDAVDVQIATPRVEELLGQARRLLAEHPGRARQLAVMAMKLEPRNTTALNLLTASYARARAKGLDREQERFLRRQAIHDYQYFVDRRPDDAELRYRIASEQIALGRLLPEHATAEHRALLQQARAHLSHLIGLTSDNPAQRASAYYQRGRANKHLGDLSADPASAHAAALKDFKQALKLDERRIDALGEIILIHRGQNNLAAAIQTARDALPRVAEKKLKAKVSAMLGNLLLEAGRPEEAVTVLRQALRDNDNLFDAHYGLSRALMAAGDADAAYRHMLATVERHPDFADGHALLGHIAEQRGDSAAAIRHYENLLKIPMDGSRVIGMHPSVNLYRNQLFQDAAARLGWYYLEKRNPQRALRALAVARRLGPLPEFALRAEQKARQALGTPQATSTPP